MRLADHLGLVVIDEVPAVSLHLNFGDERGGQRRRTWQELGTAVQHAQAIRELIARDKNHPCVVMWSLANEPASEEEGAEEYFLPLIRLARQPDPQGRPLTITLQILATPESDCLSDLVNVIALNRYYGWYSYGGQLEAARALFADFQTVQQITRVQGNKKGVFTRERRPKMATHALRERWRAIPDFGYKGKA